MVEADAEARKETIAVHQEIQAERVSPNQGFEKLEAERQQIAQQRRTASILVPAVKMIGGVMFATAVVVFCVLLVNGLRRADAPDAELNELLVRDLVSEHPRLLNGPGNDVEGSSITNHSQPPLLPAAGQIKEAATQQGDSK